MKFGHFFVDRPIFASLVSIVIVIIGIIAFYQLPASEYPEIAPPQINVTTNYPGADAETVERTVDTPIEQDIHGVEQMQHTSSYSTANGTMHISDTFKPAPTPHTHHLQTTPHLAN